MKTHLNGLNRGFSLSSVEDFLSPKQGKMDLSVGMDSFTNFSSKKKSL